MFKLFALITSLVAALLIAMPHADAKARKAHKATAKPPVESAERKEKADATRPIPQPVIDALADGNLSGALIAIHDEKVSPKLLYLMREVTKINDFQMNKKPKRADAHKVYQNTAIGYHNLYLFLKGRGIEQKDYLKQAHRYYGKARSAATLLHKADSDLLEAALYAASGDRGKAEKVFSKIDETAMRGDFEATEYLATYHAAIGDIPEAIKDLESAHRINPDALMTWIAVGDDFNAIAGDQRYQELLVSWKAADAERRLTLSVPKATTPRLEVADESGLFRPQKSMPHYNLKKSRSHTKLVALERKNAKNKGKSVAKGSSVKKDTGKKSAATMKSSSKKKSSAAKTKKNKKR